MVYNVFDSTDVDTHLNYLLARRKLFAIFTKCLYAFFRAQRSLQYATKAEKFRFFRLMRIAKITGQ